MMSEQTNNNKTMQVDSQFREVLAENWLRWLALIVTASLTGFAAYSLTGSVLYIAALVGLAEGATLFWTSQSDRNGNPTQNFLSIVGLVLAWGAIVATDLSAAAILGNLANVEVFSAFAAVPEIAQRVVVFVLPILAVGHGLLGTAHYYFSEGAALQREINKTLREARKDIEEARAQAAVDKARAQASEYARIAKTEAPKLGTAAGAALWTQENKPAEVAEVQPEAVPFGKDGKAR